MVPRLLNPRLRPVNDFATAVVPVAAIVVSGLVSVLVPRISGNLAKDLARENRIQQRLADAYVDVLQIVEREGLWLQAAVTNLKNSVWDEYEQIPRLRAPEPTLADQATAAALLAAFGSNDVRENYDEWRSAMSAALQEREGVYWNLQESGDPDARPSEQDLRELAEIRYPREQAARSRLADAIARELGHRPTSTN